MTRHDRLLAAATCVVLALLLAAVLIGNVKGLLA